MCALPVLPSSYWRRLASITDSSKDDFGSADARKTLMRESLQAYLENPVIGVGAGEFKDWNNNRRIESWHEAHNVWLQVAAELGTVGLAVYLFLVLRGTDRGLSDAASAPAWLWPRAGRARRRPRRSHPRNAFSSMRIRRRWQASFAGWIVCSLFASVAYNWTFYYLLALRGDAARHPPRTPAAARSLGTTGGFSGRARGCDHQRTRGPGMTGAALAAIRRVDRNLGQRSGRRRVLVDARTPVNFTMVAPLCRAMAADPRVTFFFTASEEPNRLRDIYQEALALASGDLQVVTPARARLMRFDAYLASDFMWQPLPRGTCRIQMFHGVGGKYGFDAPTTSMRAWDRIFFVNERRLRNFVKAGAIDAGSPAIRMVGLPEDRRAGQRHRGCATRCSNRSASIRRSRPILYAPTWSPASSLNAMGVDLVARLMDAWSGSINLIVKLHDRSRDVRERYFRRRRLGVGARAAAPRADRRRRARTRHLSVSRRVGSHGHRPQLGGLRVPAARSADRPHP
jgi:hypothetical protein